MRKPLIIGNWKMNGNELLLTSMQAMLQSLDLSRVSVAICPPFVYLPAAKAQFADTNISYGAQDLSAEASGAFTGQISAQMLRAMGCKYGIIGHSERRALCAETSEMVAHKCAQALAAGIIPVVCVGETDVQRELGQTESVILGQLKAVVDHVGIDALGQAVIAYEPVWAIGTGKAATAEQAQAVHHSIRSWLATQNEGVAHKVQLLYGGSVNEGNARELFSQPDIDGGLIGGASLKPETFAAIVQATG
jgi:triosephosphate isomerase (TIM)